jgi:4-amino-4-deoxy-L-arabinose transferase-like glycosyltransferase
MTGRAMAVRAAIAVVLSVLVLVVRAAWVTPPLAQLRVDASVPSDPPGTLARVGGLHLPRGGPYVLGFAAQGVAELTVDGQRPLRGRGVVTTRVVLPAGAVGLRFAAPPGARLIWHPPGRRGDPEYVPASSLAPTVAAAATRSNPGTARGDALAAWAIVAIVVGAIGLGRRARPALPPAAPIDGPARWRRRLTSPTGVALAVFALAAAVRLWDLGAAGQTWDEDTYWSAGRNYVQNLVRGDLDALAWRWNYEHPPITKYLAGLGGLADDDFAGARALSALVMAAACAVLVLIGRRLVDLRVGALAGVIAALAPHLIAHGQIVGHEAPSVAAWALALWASLRVWDAGERGRPVYARMALVGAILGLAIMTRFVNGLAAPAIGVTILATAPPGARARAIGLGLAIIPAVAIATAIAVWPRLWSAPIDHLVEAWDKLKGTHSGEPFFGQITATPPRWYFLAYLGATTPVVILVLALGGAIGWARRSRRDLAIILVWLLAPLGVMLSPVRQDGIRYVLPIVALLALPASVGLVAAADRLAIMTRPVARQVVPAVVALYLLVTIARVHPYYLDYYNEAVGGPAGVARARRFEVAWWGEGLDRAIAYVNRHAAVGDRVHRDCVEPTHLTWFRGDLWEPVRDPRAAQWIVHYQPSWRPCPIPPDAVRVYRVAVAGAPLADVYRRGGPP